MTKNQIIQSALVQHLSGVHIGSPEWSEEEEVVITCVSPKWVADFISSEICSELTQQLDAEFTEVFKPLGLDDEDIYPTYFVFRQDDQTFQEEVPADTMVVVFRKPKE